MFLIPLFYYTAYLSQEYIATLTIEIKSKKKVILGSAAMLYWNVALQYNWRNLFSQWDLVMGHLVCKWSVSCGAKRCFVNIPQSHPLSTCPVTSINPFINLNEHEIVFTATSTPLNTSSHNNHFSLKTSNHRQKMSQMRPVVETGFLWVANIYVYKVSAEIGIAGL